MKSILLSFVLFITLSLSFDKSESLDHTNTGSVTTTDYTYSLPEDGWHMATVTYSNHKKIRKTTSELKVQVKENRVIKINLGNNIILEAENKQSNYVFSGGTLIFAYDPMVKATVAKTSVKIKEANSELSFYEISIL